jgi:hypothetical protein
VNNCSTKNNSRQQIDPPKNNSNWFSKHLLWVDCVGGLVVGLGMFAVFDWLKRLSLWLRKNYGKIQKE